MDTPSPRSDDVDNREKTPELRNGRSSKSNPDQESSDRHRSDRHARRSAANDSNEDEDEDRERRRKHRREREREEETAEEREERRRKRREREDETEEEREERRRRRRERERERGGDDDEDKEREERRQRRKERERERERERDSNKGSQRGGDKDKDAEDGDVSVSASRAGDRERDRDRDRDSHAGSARRSRRDRSNSRDSYRSSRRDRDYDGDRDRRRYESRDRGDRDRGDRYRGDRYDGRDGGYRRDRGYDYTVASPMRRRSPGPGPGPGSSYGAPPPRRRSPVYDPLPPPPPRDEATALLDEAASEARSVFVSQLAAALTSRDVGMFFEDKLGRGSVRDSRVVQDRITRRSKGIAYVELANVDLVPKAIALTGTIVMGLPIMITLTESERNNQGSSSMIAVPGAPMVGPGSLPPMHPLAPGYTGLPLNKDANGDAEIPYFRLYVGNLYYNLTADDLRQVFEPFGELAFVDLPMEPHTNRSRGYAFVQFKTLENAKLALASMNGFELAGRQIKVSTVHEKGTGGMTRAQIQETMEDNSGGGYGAKMDASARQQLMFKLSRQNDPNAMNAAAASGANKFNIPAQQTQFVQLANMFDPEAEKSSGPNWHLDLGEDIKEEVESKYGQVEKLIVDKNSNGDVYVKFIDVPSAIKGVNGLNGRYFGGKAISAKFTAEAVFKAQS